VGKPGAVLFHASGKRERLLRTAEVATGTKERLGETEKEKGRDEANVAGKGSEILLKSQRMGRDHTRARYEGKKNGTLSKKMGTGLSLAARRKLKRRGVEKRERKTVLSVLKKRWVERLRLCEKEAPLLRSRGKPLLPSRGSCKNRVPAVAFYDPKRREEMKP